MKKGTSSHPKVADLSRALKIEVPMALGILQFLWDFTEDYAPRGDIGRFSDGTIAEHCRWRKNPDKLVCALVQTRWLDKNEEHRLLVHDWNDHCESIVHNKLARARQLFANGSVPVLTRLGKDEKAHAERFYNNLRAHGERTESARQTLSRAPIPEPEPEPEPIPEPSAAPTPPDALECESPKLVAAANGEARRGLGWWGDELFMGLVDLYRATGKPVIDADFDDAYYPWRRLDPQKRMLRVTSLKAKLENGEYSDPRYIPAPRKFVESEWQRAATPRKAVKELGFDIV